MGAVLPSSVWLLPCCSARFVLLSLCSCFPLSSALLLVASGWWPPSLFSLFICLDNSPLGFRRLRPLNFKGVYGQFFVCLLAACSSLLLLCLRCLFSSLLVLALRFALFRPFCSVPALFCGCFPSFSLLFFPFPLRCCLLAWLPPLLFHNLMYYSGSSSH